MNKRNWTFLSNHGRIFVYVAEHQQATTQFMAGKAGLSIRAVQTILDDLVEEGYIVREKLGRHNRYEINPEKPLRHRLERHHNVGDVLKALHVEVRKKEIA